jgi:uridine kinase
MIKRPRVLSVSGVSGGGKTTTIKHLIDRLDRAQALYFDDYEFENCPDICDWVEAGADYNAWELSPLITEIQLLLKDQTLDYIVLDYPFAYLNDAVRDFIDLAFYIDTPLDIAMARRILRNEQKHTMHELQSDLKNYLARGRAAYLEMEKTVKANSDVIIQGDLPIDLIVERMIDELHKSSM